jgi:hypothetical protein
MWSYPNLIPLPESAVADIAASVEQFEYDAIYGAWWDRVIPTAAKEIVMRSAERYAAAIRGEVEARTYRDTR